MRQKAKQFAILCETLQSKNGHKATDAELRQALHLNKVKYDQLVRDVNTLDQMNLASYKREARDEENTSTAIELVPDLGSEADPFANATQHDIRSHLEKAMVLLPAQEQEVLALYYFEDLNLKEIGARMQISESRVCQLHTKAISNLKMNLQANEMDEEEDFTAAA
jgi:RNA polymerase sigma factor for flagellar operon FliA